MQSKPHTQAGCIGAEFSFQFLDEKVHFGQTVSSKFAHDDSVIFPRLRQSAYCNVAVSDWKQQHKLS